MIKDTLTNSDLALDRVAENYTLTPEDWTGAMSAIQTVVNGHTYSLNSLTTHSFTISNSSSSKGPKWSPILHNDAPWQYACTIRLADYHKTSENILLVFYDSHGNALDLEYSITYATQYPVAMLTVFCNIDTPVTVLLH